MVAAKWNWDSWYMLTHFGWKAAIAVFVNALAVTLLFKDQLVQLPKTSSARDFEIPFSVMLVHVVFLAGVVTFAHHPAAFLGLFLFFIGFAQAYPRYQDSRLLLREGLLVAFFLAGLVVLGGLNDGVWPKLPEPDPWLNRKMRKDAGLLLPERQIGLAAHDFQQAIAAKQVILTRAVRSEYVSVTTNNGSGALTLGGAVEYRSAILRIYWDDEADTLEFL